jgi:glycosyltransferase involved in cell wall biosynthesis
MKIGFDVAQTCVEKAGCGYYADSLARAFAKNFPEHELILYHHFGSWHNDSTTNGTHIDAANVKEPLKDLTKKEASALWTSPNVDPNALGNPDVVIANCFQCPKIDGAKSIFTVYDTSFWSHPQFHTEPNRVICQNGILEAIENADAFSFISQHSKSDFETIFPGWLSKQRKEFTVTPLAARGTRHSNICDNFSNRNYWLSVGSLEPRKNVDTLLDAYEIYAASQRSPKTLKLAGGTGWSSERTRDRIASLSKSLPIEHLGYVSDEELEILYANAYAFIFPSWYEGFGLPVVEAMNQATPVITTLESSLCEIAKGASLNFNPQNPGELAQAMIDLEGDSNQWKSLSEKSIARSGAYSWRKTAKTLHSLLMNLTLNV